MSQGRRTDGPTDRRTAEPAPRRLVLLFAALLVACGGRKASPALDPTVTPLSPPLPLSQVYVLESWGAAPPDTTVRWLASEPRVIVVRRGAPDNNLYGRLNFPAGTMIPSDGDSVTVRLTMAPGLYGFDLTTDAREVKAGPQVSFSYAIHFVAPAGARKVYGSDIRFEQFLGVGRLAADSTLVFLDSWRPGSDLLMAPLPGAGRYLVAAPRTPPGFKAIVF